MMVRNLTVHPLKKKKKKKTAETGRINIFGAPETN
jgi:hypothetical protein